MNPFLRRIHLERTLISGAAYLVFETLGDEDLDERTLGPLRKFLWDLPEKEEEVRLLRNVLSSMSWPERLAVSLERYAKYLERQGLCAAAVPIVEHWLTLRNSQTNPLLVLARLQSKVGALSHADDSYKLVETAAAAVNDREMELRGRIGRGRVLRFRGNLPAAEEIFRSVINEAESAGLPDVLAQGYHNLGTVLDRRGLTQEAAKAFHKAFITFQKMEDERIAALSDLGTMMRHEGCLEGALHAFRTVLAHSKDAITRNNAMIELMAVAASQGDRHGFERLWKEVEQFRDHMPQSMQVDYRYQLGCGLMALGLEDRGAAFLESAAALAGEYGLHEWQNRIANTPRLTEMQKGGDESSHPLHEIALELLVFSATGPSWV